MMNKILLATALLSISNVNAGIYLEAGLGVPLSPDSGYIPDMYGIAAFGYTHHIDETLALDIGYNHRSLTGSDQGRCGNGYADCYGDNAIETKFKLEW